MIFFSKTYLLLLLILTNMVQSGSWILENLTVNSENGNLHMHIDSLKLPVIAEQLKEIFYQCKGSLSIYPLHSCSAGVVTFVFNKTVYQLGVNGWINLQSSKWKFEISDLDKQVSLYLDSNDKNKLKIKFKGLEISTLAGFFENYIKIGTNSLSGILSADVEIEFQNLIKIVAKYQVDQLSWESETGEFIIEGSNHQGNMEFIQSSTGMDLKITSQLSKGEGLFKDMYLLFDENPISTRLYINFDQQLQPASANLTLNSTSAIEFNLVLDNWYKNDFQLQYKINNLGQFYHGFVASYFEILGINDLTLSGDSSGFLAINNGKIVKADVSLGQLNLKMPSKKIQMKNLNAKLKWKNSGKMQTSDVRWDELLLAGLPIKQSQLNFSAVGQQLTFQENTVLPIFDGSILIHKLLLKKLFKPQINIDFDGLLNPVSISLITEKMGWPIMNGSISGKIPAMKKVGRSITFDGSLNLKIFDGTMQIHNLSTERLFGVAPVIAADIQFQKLNLQQITSTFDFGEISGLINGKVNGLRITNWKANRMDANFHTVKFKGVKQIISQRAIDNISSIGGIQGALSRSFLRFFDYFKYKKIGVGCKLRNSICEMSGLKTSNNTYQLVAGKGIPSINIIGYRRFIDWEIFLDRLLNAGY